MSHQIRNGHKYTETGDPIIDLGVIGDEGISVDLVFAKFESAPPFSAVPVVKFPLIESAKRKNKKWSYETILEISRHSNSCVSCNYCGVLLMNKDIKTDLYYWWYEFEAVELELTKYFIQQMRCRENNSKSPLCTKTFEFTDEWLEEYTKPLTIDHDLPVYRGGSDDTDNLSFACRSCNCKKGILTPNEYLSGKSQAEIRSIIDGIITLNEAENIASIFDDDDISGQAQIWRSVYVEQPE